MLDKMNKQYTIGKGDFCEIIKGKYKTEVVTVIGAVVIDQVPMVMVKLDLGEQIVISRRDLKLL